MLRRAGRAFSFTHETSWPKDNTQLHGAFLRSTLVLANAILGQKVYRWPPEPHDQSSRLRTLRSPWDSSRARDNMRSARLMSEHERILITLSTPKHALVFLAVQLRGGSIT